MRRVVGVIGHVDHGKTALVHALTGMDTDRLEEEKRRGISIVLGFAHLTVAGAASETIIDLVDMPGHERFVRTMVSGATGMQAALLVVAANEGIKPQTLEHLDIVSLLGVRRLVVAVSKADLVSAEEAEMIAGQAAELAEQFGLRIAASAATSSVTGQGIAALREALADIAGMDGAPDDDGFPYLPIDRVFTMQGHGTVVTGTLRRGRLSVDDEISLFPGDRPVRLRGLQVHGTRVPAAEPGQRVAANLRDIEPGEIHRGAALSARGMFADASWLSVGLRAVASAPALPTGTWALLLFGTEEVAARIRLLDRDVLLPGERAVAQLRCAAQVAVPARERFILRQPSPPLTIAGGQVIDPCATRLRRFATGSLRRLAACEAASPAGIIREELKEAGAHGVAVARLAQLGGVAPARVAASWHPAQVVLVHGDHAVMQDQVERVRGAIPDILAPHAQGVPRDHLASLIPWAGPAVIEAAIGVLIRGGVVVSASGTVRLHVAEREHDRAATETAEADRLAEKLLRGGLSPPDPEILAPGPQGRRLANILVRNGVAVRAPDKAQKRELLFHVEAVESAKRRLAPLLTQAPGLLAGEAGAALGISRKYSLPLLEYLDSVGFTRRTADRRMLAIGK